MWLLEPVYCISISETPYYWWTRKQFCGSPHF